eukprot:7368101-Pyramimonas_sp.AAC.1
MAEGWSGTPQNYASGNADVGVIPREDGACSLSLFLDEPGAEVQCKRLTPVEKKEFDASDSP